jgi:hypothetical protein
MSSPHVLLANVSAVNLLGTLSSHGSAFSLAILVKVMRTTSDTVNPMPANTAAAW